VEEVGLWEVLGEAVGNEMLGEEGEEEAVSLIGPAFGEIPFFALPSGGFEWNERILRWSRRKYCFLSLFAVLLGSLGCV
jgi:hypothetical protein